MSSEVDRPFRNSGAHQKYLVELRQIQRAMPLSSILPTAGDFVAKRIDKARPKVILDFETTSADGRTDGCFQLGGVDPALLEG